MNTSTSIKINETESCQPHALSGINLDFIECLAQFKKSSLRFYNAEMVYTPREQKGGKRYIYIVHRFKKTHVGVNTILAQLPDFRSAVLCYQLDDTVAKGYRSHFEGAITLQTSKITCNVESDLDALLVWNFDPKEAKSCNVWDLSYRPSVVW